MSKSLGAGFKLTIGPPDKLVKFTGARGQAKPLKIKSDALGLIKMKSLSDNIKLSGIKLNKGKSGISGVADHINTMMKDLIKPSKKKM
jgi:hypothetical protein